VFTEQQTKEFWEKVNKESGVIAPYVGTGCWEWTRSVNEKGYGKAYIGGKFYAAHRAAHLMENGEIPQGMLVCHRCDNPACVRPDHLFLGTHRDNMRDAIAKGRHRNCRNLSGDTFDNRNTKIKLLYSQGVSVPDISEQTGVGRSAIYWVLNLQLGNGGKPKK